MAASLAAGTKAQVAPAKLALVYVDDAAAAAAHLRLKPAEVGANVLLAAPFNAVVYERGFTSGSVEYAAVTQVAADLLTSPGRGPAEGEALLDWRRPMSENGSLDERCWTPARAGLARCDPRQTPLRVRFRSDP